MKTCPRRNFLQHWATDFCHCDRSSNSLPREFSARFQPVKSTVKVRWFNGVMNCLSRCKNTTSSFPIKPTIDFLRAPAASSEAPFFPFRFGTNCKFPDRIDRDSPTRTVLSYPCVIFHDATRTLSRVSPGDTFLFSFFFLFFFHSSQLEQKGVTLFPRSNDVFAGGREVLQWPTFDGNILPSVGEQVWRVSDAQRDKP